MASILANIELDEKQVRAFNEELNSWKDKTKKQIEEDVKDEYETDYQVKKRELEEEKIAYKTECETMVEEIKTKMQKVMVGRFTKALKEMYDELKVEARRGVLSDPRILALEEVKKVCYPLMDETVTKGYVDELQEALLMLNNKDSEIDKLKATIKLKEIIATLKPQVAEAVEAFVGDAETPEDVVERYSKLRKIVNEASNDDEDEDEDEDEDMDDEKGKKKKKGKKDNDEDEEDEDEDKDEEDEEGKKKKKSKKNDEEEEDDEDEGEDEEEDEDLEEDLEIKPSVHFDRKDKKKTEKDYTDTLNEMLNLAGIPKS